MADAGSHCNQLLHLIAGRHQSVKLAVSRLEVLIEMYWGTLKLAPGQTTTGIVMIYFNKH